MNEYKEKFMSTTAKILCFAGSTRSESYNKKLAQLAASIVKTQDVEATFIDLREYSLPVYDSDDEINNGLPDNARQLKKLMKYRTK